MLIETNGQSELGYFYKLLLQTIKTPGSSSKTLVLLDHKTRVGNINVLVP